MTLTETDLAAALAARTGQPLPEAERAVDGMVALMRAAARSVSVSVTLSP